MPRPKSFDPETALTLAMGVFWEKGYDAASITDLTAAMGINRFSLYDTFGDKHTLYLKALDSYNTRFVAPMLEQINRIDSLDGLESYFLNLIEDQHACADRPCCMMQKAAISTASCDADAKKRVESVWDRSLCAFKDVFSRIRSAGELNPEIAIETAAWLVMITQAGLISFATTPIPADRAESAIHSLIEHLRA